MCAMPYGLPVDDDSTVSVEGVVLDLCDFKGSNKKFEDGLDEAGAAIIVCCGGLAAVGWSLVVGGSKHGEEALKLLSFNIDVGVFLHFLLI